MTDSVLLLGWNQPARGREPIANELFSAMLGHLQKATQSKAIAGFEPIILHPHGGDLNGFFLIRGTRDQLHKLRYTEDFLNLTTQASINVDGFGLVEGWAGEGVMTQMARWQKHLPMTK